MNPLSTGATYAYNAQGQRVTRVEDEVVTHFYYTGSALLFTTVNEYVLQTQNILDPSGTIVAGRRFEGQAEAGQDCMRTTTSSTGTTSAAASRPLWTGKARS